MSYMYIVECADGTYYVGSTWHVVERVQQHNEGLGAQYTRRRLPVVLVYTEEYPSIAEAYGREKQVQNWSRRKRRALIEGRPEDLPRIVRLQKQHAPGLIAGEGDPSPP